MICVVCKKAEAIGYEYISHPDEPPRALCGACELVYQLAAEFGRNITDKDISADEISHLLKAVETERLNPKHYAPAKWAASFFAFLRQTGKYPEMLESPRQFARQIIQDVYSGGSERIPTQSEVEFPMDTKTLVVGQKVHMITCECYEGKDGTVINVASSGVEVRATDGGLYRFDNKGYELDADRRDRLGFGPSPGDNFHNALWFSAPEFQPWRLLMEPPLPSGEAIAWEKVHALEPGQHGRITYITSESVRCICGWTAESQDQNVFDRTAKLERKILEHAEEIIKRHESAGIH